MRFCRQMWKTINDNVTTFAPGTEARTGSPGKGSRPRGLRTARVTAECWRGLPTTRGKEPRGMLPAGVDGARSAPSLPPSHPSVPNACAIYISDLPPPRRYISGAAPLIVFTSSPSSPLPMRRFQTTSRRTALLALSPSRDEKTEKSSLSFARRSVSDG